MIIYKTTNCVNGKIYIGKDSNDNPFYLGSGDLIKRAIKKYGKENFKKETLEICDGNNWSEREQYWITKLHTTNKKVGYNIQTGGEGWSLGQKHSEKTKKKMAESRLLYFKNPEARKRISLQVSGNKNPMFGKQHSEETRRLIAKRLTGKKLPEETRKKMSVAHSGCNNSMFGRHHSEEAKRKMSIGRLGSHQSEETKKKISIAFTGANHPLFGTHYSEEAKQKMSDAQKKAWVLRKQRAINSSLEKIP